MQLAVRLPSQVVVRHRSGSLIGGIHLIAPRSVPGRSTGTLLGVQSQTALRRSVSRPQYGYRAIATEAVQQNTSHGGVIALWKRALPHACPGCGGLAQTVEPNEAGYYSLTRPAVKRYLNPKTQLDELAAEEVLKKSLGQADSGLLQTLGLNSVNGDKGILFFSSRCMNSLDAKAHNARCLATANTSLRPVPQFSTPSCRRANIAPFRPVHSGDHLGISLQT